MRFPWRVKAVCAGRAVVSARIREHRRHPSRQPLSGPPPDGTFPGVGSRSGASYNSAQPPGELLEHLRWAIEFYEDMGARADPGAES